MTVALLVTLAAAAWAVPTPPAAAAADVNGYTIDSLPGDWIGDGLVLAFTPTNTTIFSASANDWLGDGISVYANDGTYGLSAGIWAPTGQTLGTGTYEASRFPTESSAGLQVSLLAGRGCNAISGTVTIHEVAFGIDDTVERFAATYEQSCDGGPAVYGELRYHATFDFTAATNPSELDLGVATVGDTVGASVEIVNAGTTTLELGPSALQGTADVVVTSDGCSDVVLALGEACSIEVAMTPTSKGPREATLIVPDTTRRGERRITLAGTGSTFASRVTLSVSSTKIEYGKKVTLLAHLDRVDPVEGKTVSIFAKSSGAARATVS